MARPKVSLPQVSGELVPEPPAAVLERIRAAAERALARHRPRLVGESADFVAAFEAAGRRLWQLHRTLTAEVLEEPRAIDSRATLARAAEACAQGNPGAFAALPDELRLLVLAEARHRGLDVASPDDAAALPAQVLGELLEAASERHEVTTPRRQVVAAVARELAARGVRELLALGLNASGGEDGDLVALLVAVHPLNERTWRRHVEGAPSAIDAPAAPAPGAP